jgi:histidine triad (HIT) family protein
VSDCLFCRIVRGEVPARIVKQDADAIVLEDLQPQAPVHLLVIPRKHVATLNDLTEADDALVGRLFRLAADAARERGVAEPGWRAVVNVNRDGDQAIFHVHLHVLGGRPMRWPPG